MCHWPWGWVVGGGQNSPKETESHKLGKIANTLLVGNGPHIIGSSNTRGKNCHFVMMYPENLRICLKWLLWRMFKGLIRVWWNPRRQASNRTGETRNGSVCKWNWVDTQDCFSSLFLPTHKQLSKEKRTSVKITLKVCLELLKTLGGAQ